MPSCEHKCKDLGHIFEVEPKMGEFKERLSQLFTLPNNKRRTAVRPFYSLPNESR
jgi:hypothetical protein